MPGPVAARIVIPECLKGKLRQLACSRTAPVRDVQRAQLVRLAAAGWNNERIARRLGVSVRLVRRWRNRFSADPRLRTLQDKKRSGRPPEVPLAVRARLVSLACERVGDDKTPFRVLWSYDALQAALHADTGFRLSVSEIGRILRNTDIRPHRVRMWLNSQDPLFAEKSRVVCQLYVAPPPNVTVLCVDEKRLFAHEHDPDLKPPGRHATTRREFEWSRNGSSVLLAAFNTRTGEVYGECRDRRTEADLIEFMEAVAARTPGKVVVIWDNLNVHHDGASQRWTDFNRRHRGRFTFVYTPKHASWLNQVECWFSILERRVLRHASFPDVATVNARVAGLSRTGLPTRLTPSTGPSGALSLGTRSPMSDFGPEAMALEWLHDHFAETPNLKHLRARKRGRVVTIESGPDEDPIAHARFRRDTVHLWLLEMPGRGDRWDGTPFRDTVEQLMELLEKQFPWTLASIAANPDGTSDPGY